VVLCKCFSSFVDGSWIKCGSEFSSWNLGRPRFISGQRSFGVRVHLSVKTRMDDPELSYHPKAHFVDPTWVE